MATVQVDGRTNVILRVDYLLPGRLHGTFLMDGVPLADTKVGFGRQTEGGHLQRVSTWRADAMGQGCSYRLLPGRHLPFAVIPREDSGDRTLWGRTFIDLPPGGEVHVTVPLVSRRLTLRLRDSDGEAPGRRRVLVDALDHPVGLQHLFTDRDGVLELDPAPPGRLRVMGYADAALDSQRSDRDELPATHELAVIAADRTGEVDLVLPR